MLKRDAYALLLISVLFLYVNALKGDAILRRPLTFPLIVCLRLYVHYATPFVFIFK